MTDAVCITVTKNSSKSWAVAKKKRDRGKLTAPFVCGTHRGLISLRWACLSGGCLVIKGRNLIMCRKDDDILKLIRNKVPKWFLLSQRRAASSGIVPTGPSANPVSGTELWIFPPRDLV